MQGTCRIVDDSTCSVPSYTAAETRSKTFLNATPASARCRHCMGRSSAKAPAPNARNARTSKLTAKTQMWAPPTAIRRTICT